MGEGSDIASVDAAHTPHRISMHYTHVEARGRLPFVLDDSDE